MKSFIIKNQKILCGTLTFAVIFVLTMVIDQKEYPHDSETYFNLSNSFIIDGKFSLLNIGDAWRGVVFPLLLFPFNQMAKLILGSELLGWRILISLFSGIFAMTYPTLFKPFKKVHYLPLPIMLLLIVWGTLFIFPLSDLIAVYLLTFALVLILNSYNRIKRKASLDIISISQAFFSGILLYATYNTRTIYLFVFPLILLVIFQNRKIGFINNLIIGCALILGILFLGGFQGYLNYKFYDKISLLLSPSYGGYDNLFLFQLASGLEYNLCEGYMLYGNHFYPYQDPAGIMLREAGAHEIKSYIDYFRLMLGNPIEALGLYTRHFLVLLNPLSRGAYVYSHDNSRFLLTILNYSILFLAVNFIKRKLKSLNLSFKELKSKLAVFSTEQKSAAIACLTYLLPFIFIMPGAVEDRFGLGFWVIMYGIVAYLVDFKQEILHYRKHWFVNAVGWCFGFAFLMSVLTLIYAMNPEGSLLPILDLR